MEWIREQTKIVWNQTTKAARRCGRGDRHTTQSMFPPLMPAGLRCVQGLFGPCVFRSVRAKDHVQTQRDRFANSGSKQVGRTRSSPVESNHTMPHHAGTLFFGFVFVVDVGSSASGSEGRQSCWHQVAPSGKFTRRGTWCRWRWPQRRRHGQPCRGRWRA